LRNRRGKKGKDGTGSRKESATSGEDQIAQAKEVLYFAEGYGRANELGGETQSGLTDLAFGRITSIRQSSPFWRSTEDCERCNYR